MNNKIEKPKDENMIVAVSDTYAAMIKGEVDIQIATAHAYPRSITKFKEQVLALAGLDEETAQSCFYALPRAGKLIKGESVRFAEIVASSYGNLRVQSRVIGIDEKFVTCEGVCHDLENNIAVSVQVKRRITKKNGQRYDDDMIMTSSNAGCSIALRNAVFRVVPRALIKTVIDKVEKTGMGDERTFDMKKIACFEHFKKMGVSKEELFRVLDKKGEDDVDIEDLSTLRGLLNAIDEGTATIEATFKQTSKSANLNAGKHSTKKEPKQPKNESKTESESDTSENKKESPTSEATQPDKQPEAQQEETKPAEEKPAANVEMMINKFGELGIDSDQLAVYIGKSLSQIDDDDHLILIEYYKEVVANQK
ncbi:MAG: hypothetical protein DRQ46_00050 [Gammaproteobacteria bacterium]|nr:MAG: hypothetical protein DRQ46_00050 [Gammaproteobacteria bacterium]